MQIYPSGSQPLNVTGGTYDGILVVMMLFSNAPNTQILPTDFLKNQITCVTTLYRGGKSYQINNDNLQTLGTYWTIRKNYDKFYNGTNIIPPAAGVTNQLMMTAHIKFGANITVFPGDKLISQWQYNASANGANLAAGNVCFLDVTYTPAIGISKAIPVTLSEAALANQNSQSFVGASGVNRIMFLNFDEDDFANQVISSVGVNSDKLSYSVPWYESYADDERKWPDNIPYRYGTTLATAGASVVRGQDWLPQCFQLYKCGKGNQLLNNCSVTLNFNKANVNAGENYVVSTRVMNS